MNAILLALTVQYVQKSVVGVTVNQMYMEGSVTAVLLVLMDLDLKDAKVKPSYDSHFRQKENVKIIFCCGI